MHFISSGLSVSRCFQIGICREGFEASEMSSKSLDWGYLNHGLIAGKCGPRVQWLVYSAGDVVGCGVDYSTDTLYFTRNGQCSGIKPLSNSPDNAYMNVEKIDGAPTGRLFVVVSVGRSRTVTRFCIDFDAKSPFDGKSTHTKSPVKQRTSSRPLPHEKRVIELLVVQ